MSFCDGGHFFWVSFLEHVGASFSVALGVHVWSTLLPGRIKATGRLASQG